MLAVLPPLSHGSKAVCSRCKTTLSTRWDEPRKRPIGYALSALFMLVLANIFPFINMRVAGLGNEDPFAIFTGNTGNLAEIIGVVAFVVVVGWIYKWTQKAAGRDEVTESSPT